jgi:hypothetical protein
VPAGVSQPTDGAAADHDDEHGHAHDTAGAAHSLTLSAQARRSIGLAEGDVALRRGARLGPGQLALAAGLDRPHLLVARRPVVSILATGDELLGTLREHLRCHFEQEESGGFLEESIARMPRLSVAAREVVAEHPRLLAELDTLVDKLPTQDVRDDSWDEAVYGFAAFANHLLAHERNENAVVQQGYNEDFGFGD